MVLLVLQQHKPTAFLEDDWPDCPLLKNTFGICLLLYLQVAELPQSYHVVTLIFPENVYINRSLKNLALGVSSS